MVDLKNGHKSLGYKFLEDINGIKEKEYEDKLCVLRYNHLHSFKGLMYLLMYKFFF